MHRHGFLSLKSFVNRSAGWPFHFPASLLLVLALPALPGCGGEPPGKQFIRADSNGDGIVNITDGIFVLNFLFLGGPAPPCQDSADSNDDSLLNITDGIFILNFLFLGGPEPPAPSPGCGVDPSGDADGIFCETANPSC